MIAKISQQKNRISFRCQRFQVVTSIFVILGLVMDFTPIPAQQAAPPQSTLVFDSVTVVDVVNGTLIPEQVVVVFGNRIQALGPTGDIDVPSGAKIINAKDKYLIPGLWDMHVHVDNRVYDYPKFIANGITGIREMAQRYANGIDTFRIWQGEVMAGTRIGPRSIGPSVDLTNPEMMFDTHEDLDRRKSGDFSIPSNEDAPFVMEVMAKDYGIAFVKYHGGTNADRFFGLLRGARKVGLPFVAHIPEGVSSVAASDSGMRSVEHTNTIHECFPDPVVPADSATLDAQCAPVVEAFIRNGTWFTPTAVMWFARRPRRVREDQRERLRRYPRHEDVIERMHRFGFRQFLAGTDYYMVDPGFTLLQELALLVRAGLTPLEALQAATLHPAQYLEATDSLGTVAEGKVADLVLLDANPLANIRNVMKISAVVANGRYFGRVMLDAMDSTDTRLAQEFAEDEATLAEIEAAPPQPLFPSRKAKKRE